MVNRIFQLTKDAIRRFAANIWRRAFRKTTFCAVSGSSGKTTATLLLCDLLSQIGSVQNAAIANTPHAVPKQLLSSNPIFDRYHISELGVENPGDMTSMISLLKPDVGILTLIGLEHRSSLRSREGIAQEKSALISHLPADGLAVLNADDPLVLGMQDGCPARVVTYGKDTNCDLHLVDVRFRLGEGLTMDVDYRGDRFSLTSPLIGTGWVISIMAATLAALELGVERRLCQASVAGFLPYFMRLSLHRTQLGQWYILDTQKAPFWSLEGAFCVLKGADVPRKTIIIGTISDTHGTTRSRYYDAARMALDVADRVIFCGPQAARVRREIDRRDDDRLIQIDDFADLLRFLDADIVPGEVILAKASRVDHFERLVYRAFGPVPCDLTNCGLLGYCGECKEIVQGSRAELNRQRDLWIKKAEVSEDPLKFNPVPLDT